jgi:hypothetical protein
MYSSGPDNNLFHQILFSLIIQRQQKMGRESKTFFELATFTSLGVGAVREILLLSTFPVSGCFVFTCTTSYYKRNQFEYKRIMT